MSTQIKEANDTFALLVHKGLVLKIKMNKVTFSFDLAASFALTNHRKMSSCSPL